VVQEHQDKDMQAALVEVVDLFIVAVVAVALVLLELTEVRLA
jgi:hypothetical protein